MLLLLVGVAGVVLLIQGIVRQASGRALLGVGVVIASFVLALAFTPPSTGAPAPARSKLRATDVQVACQAQVEDKLLSPSSARYADDFYDTKPRWDPDALTWTWEFGVDSLNGFGVRIPTRWACDIKDDAMVRVVQIDR